jgi:hypothetical protein
MCLTPHPSLRGTWIPDKIRRVRLLPVAAAVVLVVKAQPQIGVRGIRVAVRARIGHCADADTDAAMYLVGAGLQRTIGFRGAHHYAIDPTKIPNEVLAHLATVETCDSSPAPQASAECAGPMPA